jgi:hypothetical protein
MTTVHEVFDPQGGGWTTAAPMLEARSGMNGVLAQGCFHIWGGEGPAGMFPDHDYYDPQGNKWVRLMDMPTPVHGIFGAAFENGLIWALGGGTGIGGNFGSTLNQVFQSNYRIRKQPRLGYLSTIESVAYLLMLNARSSGAEDRVPHYKSLMHWFDYMVDQQIQLQNRHTQPSFSPWKPAPYENPGTPE